MSENKETPKDEEVNESWDEIIDDIATDGKIMESLSVKMTDAKALIEPIKMLQKKADYYDEQARKYKAAADRLLTRDLPSIFVDVGVTRLDGDDYTAILKPIINASIVDQSGAIKFITESGYEDIIKTQVKLYFDRGFTEIARKLMKASEKYCTDGEMKESVHPQTLTRFVKELMKEGKTIDESIKVFEMSVVKIKFK